MYIIAGSVSPLRLRRTKQLLWNMKPVHGQRFRMCCKRAVAALIRLALRDTRAAGAV